MNGVYTGQAGRTGGGKHRAGGVAEAPPQTQPRREEHGAGRRRGRRQVARDGWMRGPQKVGGVEERREEGGLFVSTEDKLIASPAHRDT